MDLEIQIREQEGVTVVACLGKLILSEETTQFGNQVRTLLDQKPVIVMDLSGLSYADSSGIGTLMGLFVAARARSGEIKFAQPSDRIAKVLKSMQLVGVMGMYPHVDDAVRSLKTGAAGAGPF
ncbi:MAG TPA: STAS domain-containing protein [Terriglobales bacterium]|nr:STAS domain-containing protein [Terriglobales bacterium]